MEDDQIIQSLATQLVSKLTEMGKSVATAESCTGGWIAKALTDIPDCSACFGFGIVTYRDHAKEVMLKVQHQTLVDHGAVSDPTVREMAEGALAISNADIAVAVSGVAGPEATIEEPVVGTVWFAWSIRGKEHTLTESEKQLFDGNRNAIRSKTVQHALQGVLTRL